MSAGTPPIPQTLPGHVITMEQERANYRQRIADLEAENAKLWDSITQSAVDLCHSSQSAKAECWRLVDTSRLNGLGELNQSLEYEIEIDGKRYSLWCGDSEWRVAFPPNDPHFLATLPRVNIMGLLKAGGCPLFSRQIWEQS